ncbi:MAG: PKD domain-containing protein, partial [Prevotella sp.]|nr:PKD domain-containing protein [Prevotella sp.]
YMNRAQFTNLSTDNARSFAWDFGDGTTSTERNPMHIYAEAGSYTVKLTARGVIKTAEAEQTIVINPANTWTANGDYTLDATAVGARNFTSLHEAFSLLSQCTPDGAISIRVAGAKDHTLDATDAATLALVKTLADKLAAAKVKMTFCNEAPRKITINFSAGSNQARLQQLMALLPHLEGVNADMAINGAVILASEIDRYSSQTICSGTQTQPETFTSISTSDKVKVKWTASVAEGCQVEGYQAIGTGNLPAMTLTNKGTAKDLVTYHVEVTLDGTPIYTYIYKVYVKPVITGRKLSLGVPDNNALRNFAPVYFTWTDMGAGVEGYTIHLIRTDIEADEVVKRTTGTAISLEVAEGATYEWYVTAHGDCGETVDSEKRTLNIRYLADLEVVSITVPE